MMILQRVDLIFLVKNYYDVIFAAIVSVVVTRFLTKRLRKSSHQIPGRLGLPLIGETLSYFSASNSTKGCYEFIRCRRLRYGDWFKTRLFGKLHVFVPSVEGAKTILTNDFQLFNKGYVKPMADVVGKNSLFSVPVEDHKRIRRLLSEPFSVDSLSKFVTKFDKMLSDRFRKLAKDGKSFVLLNFTMKLTFDAMCDMLMTIKDESVLNQIQSDCNDISSAILSIPIMIPGTRYYKGVKARQRLTKFFEEMIAHRRSSREPYEDFLQSMLQRESYPDSEKLSDSEIMDNLITLILSGQVSSAASMMWSVKFLDDNKQVQETLRKEQLSILRNKPKEALLCLDDLNDMSYAEKVSKETLRMGNLVLWLPRVALDDCTIQGVEIKKGWHVNVDSTRIHFDSVLYKDPLLFKPSRFDEIPKPYSYLPFGAGPRTCLGINMGKATMLVFLHRLTSGYKFTVDDHDLSLEEKSHVPRLKSGLPITLTALKEAN